MREGPLKKGAPPPAPVPDFTSDRMRMLRPLITPRVMEIAMSRLVNNLPRLDSAQWRDDYATKRLALIVLLEMNPAAYLTNEEEGIRRGCDADTVGKMKVQGNYHP